jgi:hypothetical protein
LRKGRIQRTDGTIDKAVWECALLTAVRDEIKWRLSSDNTEKLDKKTEEGLEKLKRWLSENMRVVKPPELLIEIDNELKITRQFLPAARQSAPNPEEICAVIATFMAHGYQLTNVRGTPVSSLFFAAIFRHLVPDRDIWPAVHRLSVA